MGDWQRAHAGPDEGLPLRDHEQRRREELNRHADTIEWVLENHKLNAAVVGGTANQRMARFQLLPAPGVRINQVAALTEELALHLGVAECRISRNGPHIMLEIPLADAQPVALLPLLRAMLRRPVTLNRSHERFGVEVENEEQPRIPADSAVLGIDDREATPLILKLASPDVAHILISGNTGSGKTVLARSIVFSLAFLNDPIALRLILIDPKRRGYTPFVGLPHMAHPIVSEAEQVVSVLEALVEEMLRRDAQSSYAPDAEEMPVRKATRSRRKPAAESQAEPASAVAKLDLGSSMPRIVVVIDELADLILNGGSAGKEITRLLTRLTLRGREAGVHVIACTQKPSADLLGGLSKSNFPTRLVGRVSSADDARLAAGIGSTGAERLLGQGDFLLVYRGAVQRFQAAHISAQDIQREVRRIRERHDLELIQQRRVDKERQQRAQQYQRSQLEDLDEMYLDEEQPAVRERRAPYRAERAQVLPPPERRMPAQHLPIADNRVNPPVQRSAPVRQPEPEPEDEFEQEEFVEQPVRARSKKKSSCGSCVVRG